MDNTNTKPHNFHIPVMGTGFSIDTPIKVAKYGITSVISIVDDILIEQIREYYCEKEGELYEPIEKTAEDSRSRRITAYLNLVDRIVKRDAENLKAEPFEEGSDISRYFELLPDSSLRSEYEEMLSIEDPELRARKQEELRDHIVVGAIDVNIMTKIDRKGPRGNEDIPSENSDALAALRGFANSTLQSSIIFSAGLNPRLYAYIAKFEDFVTDKYGEIKKKIILKVSDYRSALVQGKFLAKRGLWVSEYRVESGLNCGGHAFATQGYLMGTILEEFKTKKHEMLDTLQDYYSKALDKLGIESPENQHDVRITVQGGIGTAEEAKFLKEIYKVDGTGWATPFLLVPEVTNIDDNHLEKLSAAGEDDVYLSDSSPFGLPFWMLRNSTSEDERLQRIADDKPGSPCPKGFLIRDTEFTEHQICHASRNYIKRKLEQVSNNETTEEQLPVVNEGILLKSCICHQLGGSVKLKLGVEKEAPVVVCTGPNIANFTKIATLEEMVSHIYGRLSLMTNPDRSHMFINELKIYVKYIRKEIDRYSLGLSLRAPKWFKEFQQNLLDGIEYYRGIAEEFIEEKKARFLFELNALAEEIEDILPTPITEEVEPA